MWLSLANHCPAKEKCYRGECFKLIWYIFQKNPSICKSMLMLLSAEGDVPYCFSLSSTHFLQFFLISHTSFFHCPHLPAPNSIPLLMVAQAGDNTFWGLLWTVQWLLCLAGCVARGIAEPFLLAKIFTVFCNSSLRFLLFLPTWLKSGKQLKCCLERLFRQPKCNHANACP